MRFGTCAWHQHHKRAPFAQFARLANGAGFPNFPDVVLAVSTSEVLHGSWGSPTMFYAWFGALLGEFRFFILNFRMCGEEVRIN